jgi:hypothetical protein
MLVIREGASWFGKFRFRVQPGVAKTTSAKAATVTGKRGIGDPCNEAGNSVRPRYRWSRVRRKHLQ